MPGLIEPTRNEENPISVFVSWFDAAEAAELNDPEAASLATIGEDGVPGARMVLVKKIRQGDFVFFTNCRSRKGADLLYSDKVSLLFHWKSLRRQVKVSGFAVPVSPEEADDYFAGRHRSSQVSAWASDQSSPLVSQEKLNATVREYEGKFAGKPVPRPEHWSGFRVVPLSIEFWQHRPSRLHRRVEFNRKTVDSDWEARYLNP